MMIPRAGDVCQPQTSVCGDFVEPGTPQAPDTHVGQFPESGTCPSTRCPQVLIPSLRDTSQPPTSARRSLAPRLSRTSRYPCVVIPRARNVCEPPPPQTPTHGANPRDGDISQPRLPEEGDAGAWQGKRSCLGARCPVARQLPGHHLLPTPLVACASFQSWPSLVTHLLVGASTSPRKENSLSSFPPRSACPAVSSFMCAAPLALGKLCLGPKFSLSVPRAHVGHPGVVALAHVPQRCPLSLAFPHVPRTTVFANGSLLITQVRARSTGVYKCVGRGQRGKALVLKATLRLAGEVLGLVAGRAAGPRVAVSLWSDVTI